MCLAAVRLGYPFTVLPRSRLRRRPSSLAVRPPWQFPAALELRAGLLPALCTACGIAWYWQGVVVGRLYLDTGVMLW